MASITNASSHRIDLADLSLEAGQVIEHFKDADAERLKASIFYRAGWLVIGPSPEPEPLPDPEPEPDPETPE